MSTHGGPKMWTTMDNDKKLDNLDHRASESWARQAIWSVGLCGGKIWTSCVHGRWCITFVCKTSNCLKLLNYVCACICIWAWVPLEVRSIEFHGVGVIDSC